MTQSLLSCWKPLPRDSVEGWILHSSGGGQLSNELVLREEFDDPLAQVHGGKWPHLRSLPFDLDGDIDDGLL